MNNNFSSVVDVILKLLHRYLGMLQHCSPFGRAATDHLYSTNVLKYRLLYKGKYYEKILNKVTSFFVYCRISGFIFT